MSAVLVAIVDGDGTDVPARTRDGRALHTVGTGPPVAVLSEDHVPASRAATALMAHEETVSELMDAHAVLPARYGVTVSDEEVRQLLDERRQLLLNALARVRGAVELAVCARIPSPATSSARPSSGTEYLRQRLEHRAELRRVERELAPLQKHAEAQTPLRSRAAETTDAYGPALRGAYLVKESALGAFIDAVRRLDEEHPELELVCSGPWPPYSFTQEWS